ncbi:peptide chain release factor N(5)-glutamine methyltransferase [Erythrobacter crassostreae]|uniref:Peptide chain release factor N(5)-glutamine methyltransferase n=1 Tax=Erythrobacter crassostreae TaxID=2828328 RepID=A0A9X1JNE5_9SPHN|nr:peptide chain release factor N(5)-glutamine methyltransferase [Erythrobacter crassostrea]
MTVADAIRAAAESLASTSDTARLDAELLMAHALEVSRSDMLVHAMRNDAPVGFDAMISRREASEPVAYIIGATEFFGRSFEVEPGILVPRSDSEAWIDAALDICPDPSQILDLGTGSGCLLLTMLAERPQASGIGIDASPVAVEIASKNAKDLGLQSHCEFKLRSWHDEGWSDDLGSFDLVLCNPPYVEADAALDPDVKNYEPASALFAGAEGLDDYRVLIPQLRKLMNEYAVAIFEIGHTQADAVTKIAEEVGLSVEMRRDLANRPRALIFRV